ncbi:MAG: tRNA (adenosine(37)-N6)-dimethylallyltransferase MiaA [Anaeroplasmataceae bacterium]|nr:tRNA (adenosine(37)-N6)-dimethylallyltransferase MiaA [Anaeroplasmataceae bacterium]
MKHKVIVVVGPTAVGKTKVAIELAKTFHAEIISGDSIAVYKGLDIGSAKPTTEEMSGIKHHLIDILEPYEDYSVADFQKSARNILNQQDLSIICGGTGLYIQATLFNYEFLSEKRDDSYSLQYQALSNEELFALLKEKDPSIDEKKLHPNNRKRVLRALEVLETTGKSIHSFNRKVEAVYDYFICYLKADRNTLYKRIEQRVDAMIEAGLAEEVKALAEQNIYPKGIGYREWVPYFKQECSLEEVTEEIKKNSRHLAKRQETWFQNQMDSHFYAVNFDDLDQTIDIIKKDIQVWLEK